MEVALEQYAVRKIKNAGGWALKLVCPGVTGVPDRLVLFPGGRVSFIEFKNQNAGRLSPRQIKVQAKLKELGFEVWVIDSKKVFEVYMNGGGR